MGEPLLYPDNGQRYEDASILTNAVLYTTAQRAYIAAKSQISLAELQPVERAYLAVEVFGQWVVTLEDMTGWILVFRDWKPGTAEGSLFALLDQVKVNT